MRFNLHENANVLINVTADHKMAPEEVLAKYTDIIQYAEILFERRNAGRRVFVIKHGIQHYIVSVIGTPQLNEIFFFRFKVAKLDAVKADINKKMDAEDLKYEQTGGRPA